MNLLKLFFSVLVFGALVSCELNTHTHFNKNYSGTSTVSVDLEDLMGFTKMMSEGEQSGNSLDSLFNEMDSPKSKASLDTLREKMEEVGVKNFTIQRAGDSGIQLLYDFDDLEVFSSSFFEKMSEALDDEAKQLPFADKAAFRDLASSEPSVSRKGKWMTINLLPGVTQENIKQLNAMKTNDSRDEESDDNELLALLNGFQFLGDMLQLNTTYSFDRKIKTVESDLPYLANDHSIELKYNVGDLVEAIEEKGQVQLRVRLK